VIAILDVDGTLVDTNYQHAVAWYRAFRKSGITLPVWRIHRHIGMGGDQLVEALCGEEAERDLGDEIRSAEKELYSDLIGEVEPLPDAHALIDECSSQGATVILASSAKEEEVDHYLDLLSARERVDGWTTSADVEETKPEPDLVLAALEKGGGGDALLIGDTPWDVIAAARAGVATVALLTGGFSDDELTEAGAVAVHESLGSLVEQLASEGIEGLAARLKSNA
jgi:HAD superfamily hydrolase (TIGR01509 family)